MECHEQEQDQDEQQPKQQQDSEQQNISNLHMSSDGDDPPHASSDDPSEHELDEDGFKIVHAPSSGNNTSQITIDQQTIHDDVVEDDPDHSDDPMILQETTSSSDYFLLRPQVSGSSDSFTTFFRGCKWAPDGSCLMTNNMDNNIRIYNLPEHLITSDNNPVIPSKITPALKVKESDLIYDFCWFPDMRSTDPVSCVFGVTSGTNPIRLIDAYNGSTRGTYRAYDHLEQRESAHSLSFSHDGLKIYAGYNKKLRIFDTCTPGKCYTEIPTYVKKEGGQRGIISCIAVNPSDPKIIAVGSYSRQISLNSVDECTPYCMLEGQKGGVTHMIFSPDGYRLYTGGRRDAEILCWDIRNLGCILCILKRNVTTNQRMYFDLNPDGSYIFSGNNDGKVTIWNTHLTLSEPEQILGPVNSFTAHDDCVNGISVHPSLPLVATCSGQRKFPEMMDSDEDDSDVIFDRKSVVYENLVKLWSFQTSTSQSSIVTLE